MVKLEDFKSILNEKKLFSPGPLPKEETIKITFSHRSKEFKKLYKTTKEKLRKKFKIPKQYKILFVQGSGTAAIETVLSSLDEKLMPQVILHGVFSERARNIAMQYTRATMRDKIGKYLYYTQFETSKSDYRNYDDLYKDFDLVIVDCVSGFGFYPLPKADVILISSSKILGGLPVLGIILYNKKAEKYFRDRGDYLNVMKYIEYDKDNETPHTSLIPQIISLNKSIPNVISKKQIEENCKALYTNKVLFEGRIIAPVLTLHPKRQKFKKLMNVFKKYNIEIYHNPAYMNDYFQVSMFNYKDVKYYALIKFILEENG